MLLSVIAVELEKQSKSKTINAQEIIWGNDHPPKAALYTKQKNLQLEILFVQIIAVSLILVNWRILFLENLYMSVFGANYVRS